MKTPVMTVLFFSIAMSLSSGAFAHQANSDQAKANSDSRNSNQFASEMIQQAPRY